MPVVQTDYTAPRADLGVAFWEYWNDGEGFIATKALAPVRVPKKSANESVITRESVLTIDEDLLLRAPNGEYYTDDVKSEDMSYACKEYGIQFGVEDSKRAEYARDFSQELAANRHRWFKLMLGMEKKSKDVLWDATTSWPSGTSDLYTDNSGTPWDTITTDIVTDVTDAATKVRLNCGLQPNALICGRAVLDDMLANTGIKAYFPGANKITRSMIEGALPDIFGLQKIIVGTAVSNSNNPGQTFSGSDVWGSTYAMVAVVADDGDPLDVPAFGRTFMWAEDAPELVTTDEYYLNRTRTWYYRARSSLQFKVIDPYFAHLMAVNA